MTIQNNLLMKNDKIIIPKKFRKNMLREIHKSHIGVEGCLRRARDSVFWPGMNQEIKDVIACCDTCNTFNDA